MMLRFTATVLMVNHTSVQFALSRKNRMKIQKKIGDINNNSRSKKKILNVEDEKNIFSFTVGETPNRFPEKSTKIPKVIIDRFDELDVIQNSDSDTIIDDCNRVSDLSTHNNLHIRHRIRSSN